ncbi:MAG: peptide ABC transporter substrate-binding protein [Opitutales bacterium]
MANRLRLLSVLLLSALLPLALAARETPVEAAIRDQVLLLGNGAEPQDLDPQVMTAFTDQCLSLALFEGLCALDEKSSLPVPAAAEGWEVSADGLVYTFHLQPGLKWSNGEPLTAGDFVASWRRVLSPVLAAEYAYLFYPVKNAEAYNTGKLADPAALGFAAPDDRTLRVVLERPTAYLPALTALPPWFPVNPRVLAAYGALTSRGTAWTRPGHLVGNGPFVLTEWLPNDRVRVARNPHYWDASHVRLNGMVFFPTESLDVDERNFRAGQVHLTYELPLSKVDSYRRTAPQSLRLDPFLETFFLRFNTTRPPLGDPRIRRALSLAIDREALSRHLLRGTRAPAAHYTPPDCAGYTATARVPTDYAAARGLLAAAGFPGGKGFPVLDVQLRNDELHQQVLEVIQAGWQRELGLTVTLSPVEQKTWVQNQQSLNYAISSARWVGDFVDPVTFLDMFTGGGTNNWTGWSDPAYDTLLRAAANATDPARRYADFQQAEAVLLREAPIAPVFFGVRSYLIHPAVRGWEPSLLGFHQYKKVYLQAP